MRHSYIICIAASPPILLSITSDSPVLLATYLHRRRRTLQVFVQATDTLLTKTYASRLAREYAPHGGKEPKSAPAPGVGKGGAMGGSGRGSGDAKGRGSSGVGGKGSGRGRGYGHGRKPGQYASGRRNHNA